MFGIHSARIAQPLPTWHFWGTLDFHDWRRCRERRRGFQLGRVQAGDCQSAGWRMCWKMCKLENVLEMWACDCDPAIRRCAGKAHGIFMAPVWTAGNFTCRHEATIYYVAYEGRRLLCQPASMPVVSLMHVGEGRAPQVVLRHQLTAVHTTRASPGPASGAAGGGEMRRRKKGGRGGVR